MAAVTVLVAAAVVVGTLDRPAEAQPAAPDQGEVAAQVVTDLTGQFSEANGIVVQPDGRVLTVGTVGPTSDPGRAGDAVILRYGTDGLLDDTFGDGGVVVADLFGELDQATAVALQADGRIVVVGTTNGRTQSSDVMVLRFESDGTPDPTFGVNGRAVFDVGDGDAAYAVAVQPGDQRIVVGGTSLSTFLVLRLDPDGSPDDTFGGDGIVLTGPYNGAQVNALVVQQDGGIVGIGSGYGDVALFRLTSGGSTDFSFGDYGFTYTDLRQGEEYYSEDAATAAVLRPDGTIAVAGRANRALAVLRYTPSGRPDGTFGGGYVLESFGEASGQALAVMTDDDRVVVAGERDGTAVLFAYEADAGRVADFGTDGRLDGAFGFATGLAPTPGGGFAVSGGAWTVLGGDSVAAAYSAAGEPAAGFGGGVVVDDIGSPGDEPAAMDIDGFGGIVVAGSAATGGGWDFALASYDEAGVLDPEFGMDGRLTLGFGGSDRLYGMDVEFGRISVAGQVRIDGRSDIAAARFWAYDGDPDTYFNGTGSVVTSLTDGDEGARAVVTQPNGNLLVAGYADAELVVLNYQADGTLSPEFGQDGVVRTLVDGGWAQASAITVQPDGKIVVVGEAAEGEGGSEAVGTLGADDDRYRGDRDFAVLRLLRDGTPDPDFGGDGVVTVDLAGGNDEATSVVVQPDGAILVAGRVFPGISALSDLGVPSMTGVLRLEPDGDLDDGFGDDGVVLLDRAPDREALTALALADDGTILLGGLVADPGAESDLAVLRLLPDGDTDDGFGGGLVRTDFGGNDEARAVAVRPDGSIVAAGVTRSAGRTAFALAGYDATGAPAAGFGSGGSVVTDVTGDLDELRAIAVQPDGRVVTAGEGRAGPAGDVAVVRYDTDGTLDETFGFGGIVLTDLSGSDGAYAVAVAPDGGIIVAGHTRFDAFVLRYTADGVPDGQFGQAGIVRFTFTEEFGPTPSEARGLAVRDDGTIVVAGSVSYRGSEGSAPYDDVGIARLTADGDFDTSFGGTGIVTTDLDDGVDAAYAVVLQDDGQIAVAGSHDGDGLLVRYRPDGSVDDTFGTDGFVVAPLGSGVLRGLASTPDGALVAAGTAEPEAPPVTTPPPTEGPPTPAVAAGSATGVRAAEIVETGRDLVTLRLTATGAPDDTFGDDGLVRAELGVDSRSGAVAVQADGAVVVAATTTDLTTGAAPGVAAGPGSDAVLVRHRTDGVPDPRFGEDGIARSGDLADTGLAVALLPDDRIAVAGAAFVAPADTDGTVLLFVGGPAGPVGLAADLAVTMSASAATVRVDLPLRYVVVVRNNGPGRADAVTVTATLPATASLLGTTAGQGEPCTLDGTELTCVLGSIVGGAEVGLTITVQPSMAGPLVTTVSVAGDQEDPVQDNDSVTVTTTVLPLAELRANPGVVPLGRVVRLSGTGFVPGATVALGYRGWGPTRSVVVAADGTFATPFVVFTETSAGPRIVEARTGTEVLATTNLLVVTDSLTPPNFAGRN
jgi:uncharacterized delta-60 repeat protein/uncharacterized repeat protein (TIGR01451 family)